MECRGRKVQITLSEDGGVLEGFIHSMDKATGRLTLEKVINCENGKKLGLQHFYESEIEEIDVLEEFIISKESEDETLVHRRDRKGVMKAKYVPGHLSKLRHLDPSKLTLKNQEDENDSAMTEEHLADNEVRSNDVYTMLAHLDNIFTEAISFIKKHQVIGVALEGVSLGRSGKLCWLQIGTPTHVFLFDILTLGMDAFHEGLKDILENQDILKVFHDCRMASDILYHQFDTKIVNVFDTQVADVFVYRLRHHNDWPRFVNALAPCLSQHLDLSPDQVHWSIIRENFSQDDEVIWEERPLKKHVVEAAVKDVIYLLELRQVLMEEMLEEYVAGVNIYLSHVRDASLTDSCKYRSMKHLLPVAFQDVRHFMESYRGRNPLTPLFDLGKDQHGFRENCKGIYQPNVIFSHDSLWHAGSRKPKENTVSEKPVTKSLIPECSADSFRDTMSRRSFEPKPINPVTDPESQGASLKANEVNSSKRDSFDSQGVSLKANEVDPSKRDSFESQENIRPGDYSPNTGARINAHETVDMENVELSGSSLMRALVYSQAGNTIESDSEIDKFVIKPAGTLQVQPRKKRQEPPVVPNTQSGSDIQVNRPPSKPRKEETSFDVSSSKLYNASDNKKTLHVKNTDKFLRDFKHVKKGNGLDSESSDSDVIPGLNIRQSEIQSRQKDNEQIENRSVPQYNFIPRGTLSQQEINLCNSRRRSIGSNKSENSSIKGEEDNKSACSDETVRSETELKNGKVGPIKTGLSLKSLLTAQNEARNGYCSGSSMSSSGSNQTVPVTQRMQALLDIIKQSQSK